MVLATTISIPFDIMYSLLMSNINLIVGCYEQMQIPDKSTRTAEGTGWSDWDIRFPSFLSLQILEEISLITWTIHRFAQNGLGYLKT